MKRALALALVFFLAGCGEEESPTQKAMQAWVGKDFSELMVQTLDGEPQPFKDVAGNQRILLNVWATWCPPCLKELPSLDELGRSERAVVVTIVTDSDVNKVKEFLRNQPWGSGMLVWHDPDGKVTRTHMGATAIPVSYILGADLKVRRVEAGERDWTSVRMIEVIEQATSR